MRSGERAQILRKILLLTANPKGTSHLRLDDEQRCIQDSLKQSDRRDQFCIQVEPAVTISHIRRALLEHTPEIVHFCGHGAGNDGIVCKDRLGQIKLVPTLALSNLFKLMNGHVKCVVLNACFAEVQANEIVKHIDVVVGMKYSIGDEAALMFAEGFYDALFAGKAFINCFDFGVNAIQLENIPEDLTPIIKLKEKGPESAVKKSINPRPKKISAASMAGAKTDSDTHETVDGVREEDTSRIHISKKVFWGAVMAILLLVVAMVIGLFRLTHGQGEIAGFYKQEIEPLKPDVDGVPDPHVKFHEIQTSLCVFFDSGTRQLHATEMTFWKIYYVPDLQNSDNRFLIGSYWAVWQISGIDTAGSPIKMRAVSINRPGFEVESRVGEKPLSNDIIIALVKDIDEINRRFRSAYFEMSLEDGGKIVRKKWYNDEEKVPGKQGIPETFIREGR